MTEHIIQTIKSLREDLFEVFPRGSAKEEHYWQSLQAADHLLESLECSQNEINPNSLLQFVKAKYPDLDSMPLKQIVANEALVFNLAVDFLAVLKLLKRKREGFNETYEPEQLPKGLGPGGGK